MTRQTPDERFAEATRAHLVVTIDRNTERSAGVGDRAGQRPSFLVGAIASLVILVLIGGVTFGLTHLPHAEVAAMPTPNVNSGPVIINPQRVTCEKGKVDGFEPFGCSTFVSFDGRDRSGGIPWLGSTPISVRAAYIGGHTQLGIGTPCNSHDVDVTLARNWLQTAPGGGLTSLMACKIVRGEREAWAVRFFAKPLAYTLENGTLTLSSGTALVRFKEQKLPPSTTSPVVWNPRLVGPARTYDEKANRLPPCRLAQLTTWGASDGAGALGTFYQGTYLRNDGPDCSLLKSGVSATLGGGLKTAPLRVTANGSAVMPAGSSERLQLAHGSGCDSAGKDIQEPVSLTVQSAKRDLNVTFPWGGGCPDLTLTTWSLTAAKEFGIAGTNNALTHLVVSVEVPGSGTFSGGTLRYVVHIRNTGKQTYSPTNCPGSYRSFAATRPSPSSTAP